ncbi:hypothetical protein [Methylocystis echinoides]|uniref:Uncharacterized protein n=1 Tax=Methylocystis echinoides TaxID=29468 RepID=A0A9W6GQJ8_9HYPH|nr:hypothetical protein [Methylocystis echinoides]GLI91075.1 hypothetical protein LMG27198_00670 [Methylocystis echinoides]
MSAFRRLLLAVSFFATGASAQAYPIQQVTTYSINTAKTYVYSSTCGTTTNTSGCYGGATLGPFRQACAIASTPITTTTQADGSTTFTRRIAVMDRGSQAGASVNLFVYLESNNVKPDSATPTTRLLRRVTLPVIGGPTASCSLARNGAGFYLGTNLSNNAVRVDDSFATSTTPGFSPPIPVAGVTSTPEGYMLVTHKSSASSGYYLFNNSGATMQSGGGSSLLVGAGNGVSTAAY